MGHFAFSKTKSILKSKGVLPMKKHIITSLLILALIVILLASCNEQETSEASANISESSVVESSVVESSVVEYNSEAEDSKHANIILNFEIPEFDIKNVIYCDQCANWTLDMDPYPHDVSLYGLVELLHNKYAYNDYFRTDTLIPEDKYVYMALSLYREAKNKLTKEELCAILNAFGYKENTEAIPFMDDEVLTTTTAGYIPYVAIAPLSKHLEENELVACYTWLSKDCISNEKCTYDYYDFGP